MRFYREASPGGVHMGVLQQTCRGLMQMKNTGDALNKLTEIPLETKCMEVGLFLVKPSSTSNYSISNSGDVYDF